MKAGLARDALIAAIAALALLVGAGLARSLWDGADSEVDRLEAATSECGPDGPHRETRDPNSRQSWMGRMRLHGPGFARYVERTQPEITLIACMYSGPALRYFEFANRDQVLGAERAYRDDQPLCVLKSALLDVVPSDRERLRYRCDELDGRLT